MKTKNTLILLILVVVLGFTSSPGSGKNQNNSEQILEKELIFGKVSGTDCRLQTRSSTVSSTGGGKFTVSVDSNWSCR